jgi:sugar lactone lactonase YvrE
MQRALVLVLLVVLVAAAAGAAVAGSAEAALPDRYVLPGEAVFPEGVAVRPRSDQFFVTSTQDGTIFRGRLGRARTEVYLPPGGQGRTSAVGVKATRDRLIIAGNGLHRVFVYDLNSRRLVRQFSTGSTGLVNDVAIAPNGDAYVTDSARGLIFRIRARQVERRGPTTRLQPLLRVSPELAPEGYTNGIAVVGRRYLIVSVTTAGLLRVDLRTRRTSRIRLTRGDVPAPDGIALLGRTLYVVNAASRVTQLALSPDLRSARVVRQITSPGFRFPTTVAVAGRRLLVVNSQFNRRGAGLTPELPFTVSSVPRPRG